MQTKKKRRVGNGASQPTPPTLSNDAADLYKIVYEAFGSKEFAAELVGILDGVLGGIEVESGMQYGIKNALAGARGQLSADECGAGINTYWEDIAKAIIKTVPEYKGRVNSGDGWVKNLAALLYLHFGTRKQEKTVVEGRGGGKKTNLMDSKNAGCIRGPNQSWPRATISAIRELVGLEHESSDIVLDSMVKANLVCITFNNPGDDVAKCNSICLEIAKKIGFKKVLQLYAVSFIPYLNQTIYHQLKQREDNNADGGRQRSGPLPLLCDDSDEILQPLPVLNCSSYTSKHVLDKNASGTSRKLVSMNTMYHPTYVLQQRTKGRTVEQIEVKDRAMTAFYTMVPEVRASLTEMLEEPSLLDEGRVILNAILENQWDSYVQIIQRLGDPTTDDERRERYETMLKYWQDAGKKSARVLKLAEKLKTWLEHSDTVLSTAIDEEESEFLLLDLEDEIRTGLYSDATSRDEFTALLNDVHKGDVQSLLSSMKSKLNAWKFNQAFNPLRKALVSIATAEGIDDIFSIEVAGKLVGKMKDLFKSTAKTVLVNTHGEAVGPDRLLLKLAAKHKGWTFCQALIVLRKALVSAAADNGIDDIFCLEVVSKLEDEGMKALFKSTAETVLVNTHGQPVGPERLLLKLAAQHTGWTFCQALIVLRMAFVLYAKQHNIDIDDIFCEAVLEKLDDGMQKLFESTSKTTLVSTNNQAIGKKRLFLKLVAPILECYKQHLPKIKKYAKVASNIVTLDDSRKVLVVPNSGEHKQTYEYLYGLRRTYGDNDTWQWDRLLKEAGISMKASYYEEATKKQRNDKAAKLLQPPKKNGHVAGNDAPSIEDDEFF